MCRGVAALRDLTADAIDEMARLAERLKAGMKDAAAKADVEVATRRAGSIVGFFLSDQTMAQRFHLAGLDNGLFFAPRGMFCLSTISTEGLVEGIIERGATALMEAAAEAW